MALYHSPRIVTNGMILYLDAANTKSYSGSGTTWNDLVTLTNVGTLTNSPSFSNEGKGSIEFDAINDHVIVTPTTRNTEVTISAWVKTKSTTTNDSVRQYIYTQQQNPPTIATYSYQQRQGLMIAGNYFQVQWFNTSNADSAHNTSIISANIWYNITWTLTRGGVSRLYLNGNLNADTTGTAPQSTSVNDAKIGRRGDAQGDDWFNGFIGVVQEYNRALSPAEVSQNFQALRGRYNI